ncbi:aldo/keto reductase [Kitasatospora sp. NPDC001159]
MREQCQWPVTKAQLAVLTEVAGELRATVNQVVLAWLIGHPVPTVPVVGASSVAQLDESPTVLDRGIRGSGRRRR